MNEMNGWMQVIFDIHWKFTLFGRDDGNALYALSRTFTAMDYL